MASRILVSDYVRNLVEREQTRRIRENWKRGYSLEQIVSEAVISYLKSEHPRNDFKDDNSVVREMVSDA